MRRSYHAHLKTAIFAMIRSIVNTGKRQGLSTFESILAALDPLQSLFALG